jgi:hypothetical protein
VDTLNITCNFLYCNLQVRRLYDSPVYVYVCIYSSFGIANGYGLDGPGIESQWVEWGAARYFTHVQTGPRTHPASCRMGTGSFPEVKRPGRGADHPTPSKVTSSRIV